MRNMVVRFLVREKLLAPGDIQLFHHAVDMIQHHLLIAISILVIGIVSGHLLESITFICVYPLMRRYSGGVHAISRPTCYILTIFSFLMLLFLNQNIPILQLSILAITAAAFVIRVAPLEVSKNVLNLRQKKQYRRYSVSITAIALAISILGLFVTYSPVYTTILLSVIFNAIDIFIISICKIADKKLYHKMISNAVLFVMMIGINNLQSTCDGWKYQPEITASLRKYMDEP